MAGKRLWERLRGRGRREKTGEIGLLTNGSGVGERVVNPWGGGTDWAK